MYNNHIIKCVINDLIVDGIRDKKYKVIYDLTRHNYKETIENIETLEKILSYVPVRVYYYFKSNGTLNGYIELNIEWSVYQ